MQLGVTSVATAHSCLKEWKEPYDSVSSSFSKSVLESVCVSVCGGQGVVAGELVESSFC